MNDNQRSPFGNVKGWSVLGRGVGGAGCLMPILIIGAILIGRQLDDQLGTKPLFIITLIFGAVVLGLFATVRSALEAARDAQREYEARKQSRYPHDTYREDE